MSKYSTATRNRFTPGFDQDTGIRRTKIEATTKRGPIEKTSQGFIEDIVFEFTFPAEFTELKVPAKDDRPEMSYNLYMLPINDGYISVNMMDLSQEVAGKTVVVRGDVKQKRMKSGGKTFMVYYLKILEIVEDGQPDHRIVICPHDLALKDQIEALGGDAIVFELGELNPGHQGGILVKPL